MLIKKLLQQPEFEALRNQYVSYVQVGGAYGYKYCPIIQFLGIKSVLITDLDYDKNATTEDAVLASHTTNETIKCFSNFLLSNPSPTVKSLCDWKENSGSIVMADTIYLAFQGKKDRFARTLEEAMLAKRYQMSALSSDTQEKWKQRRKEDKLKFVIPQNKTECSIRSIVTHTSRKKTDFMYSAILGNLVEDMLPDYIKEALLWLMK